MMRCFLVALFLVAAVSPAFAEFDTGNTYLADCDNKRSEAAQAACLMQAGALLDMMQTVGYECDVRNVTRGQTRDVLVKSLRDHPSERNKPISLLAMLAYIIGFNCRLPSKP